MCIKDGYKPIAVVLHLLKAKSQLDWYMLGKRLSSTHFLFFFFPGRKSLFRLLVIFFELIYIRISVLNLLWYSVDTPGGAAGVTQERSPATLPISSGTCYIAREENWRPYWILKPCHEWDSLWELLYGTLWRNQLPPNRRLQILFRFILIHTYFIQT